MDNIALTYTSEMEKAMHQNHSLGFAEYKRKLHQRLEIEREREKSHRNGLKVVTEMNRKVNR